MGKRKMSLVSQETVIDEKQDESAQCRCDDTADIDPIRATKSDKAS